MIININPDMWRKVFAVPAAVVDNIKTANADALKVILFCLRYSGEDIKESEIARAAGISEEDVHDAAAFWEQRGVFKKNETQSAADSSAPIPYSGNAFADGVLKNTGTRNVPDSSAPIPYSGNAFAGGGSPPPPPKRHINRDPQYTEKEITERVRGDAAAKHVFEHYEMKSGEPLRYTIQNTIALILDALPPEVAIMMIDYCFQAGQSRPAYMREIAHDWGKRNINTIALAEEEIKNLLSVSNIENKLQKRLKLKSAITNKMRDMILIWHKDWGFSEDMIVEAYEIAFHEHGKFQPNYVNSILHRWHESGISTPEQVRTDNDEHAEKVKKQYSGSDDIKALEELAFRKLMENK